MSKRVVHGWMNPKNYTKPIVARRNEAISVKVIIPGENVEPVDGIPVVVIPTEDYDRLGASEYQCREKERAIAMWDDASATMYKSLAAKDAEIDALQQRCERLRVALTAFIHLDDMRSCREAPFSALADAALEAEDSRLSCNAHNDLDAPPAAGKGATDGH